MKHLSDRPKEIVRRIADGDLEDDFESENTEKSGNNWKKRKVSEEVSNKPTDSLTTASASDNSSNKGNPTDSRTGGDAKRPLKSPFIKISIFKKPIVTSNTSVAAKPENKKEESTSLQSLCQNYDGDE